MNYLDRFFSRKVLGAVLFGAAIGKWLEKVIAVLVVLVVGKPLTVTLVVTLLAWTYATLVFFAVLVFWDRLEHATNPSI